MFDKVTLLFEILKTSCLMYEVNWKGPNLIGSMLERFNSAACWAADRATTGVEVINEWPDPAASMAKAYLDYVYAGGQEPEWILKAEAANKVVQA